MGTNLLSWKRWVMLWVTIVFGLLILVAGLSLYLVSAFREDFTNEEVIANYQRVLYGSAIIDRPWVKFDIVAQSKPDVIAIGSSRVMQFRSRYFRNRSFYTMGD